MRALALAVVLWLWVSAIAVLLGAELNAEIAAGRVSAPGTVSIAGQLLRAWLENE